MKLKTIFVDAVLSLIAAVVLKEINFLFTSHVLRESHDSLHVLWQIDSREAHLQSSS